MDISTSNKGKSVVHLDKYSKILLSVIASCLVLIVVNIYFSPGEVNANNTSQVQDVNIKSIGGSSVSGGYMPVDIQRIDGSSSKSMQVDLKSVNGRNVYGDKVPVDIQGVNGQFFIGSELPVRVK